MALTNICKLWIPGWTSRFDTSIVNLKAHSCGKQRVRRWVDGIRVRMAQRVPRAKRVRHIKLRLPTR